jgi:hypothetical protein
MTKLDVLLSPSCSVRRSVLMRPSDCAAKSCEVLAVAGCVDGVEEVEGAPALLGMSRRKLESREVEKRRCIVGVCVCFLFFFLFWYATPPVYG